MLPESTEESPNTMMAGTLALVNGDKDKKKSQRRNGVLPKNISPSLHCSLCLQADEIQSSKKIKFWEIKRNDKAC